MPSFASFITVAEISSTMTGARPSVGSSSSRHFGFAINPRAIATICCSPPDIEPARRLMALAEPRKHREHGVDVGLDVVAVGAMIGAHDQILGHGRLRED